LKNKKPLDEVGKYLEENTFGLAVVATSESKGDTGKVRLLTEARAKVVRDFLAQNFKLDDTRLKTIGLGKTQDAGDSSKLVILIYPAKTPDQPTQHSLPRGP
jgi:outer membrane protein OmpA-like peptidoglycan-associated protein